MSYRAFKRLLGETSLERKCRFLFGAGTLVLIALSFWLYAGQTEHLAYDQAVTSCRLLVGPILLQQHMKTVKTATGEPIEGKDLAKMLSVVDQSLPPDTGRDYQYHFLQEGRFDDSYERDLYKDFLNREPGRG